MLLSVSMAALSCSKGVFDGSSNLDEFQNDLTLVVSGTASDKTSGTPLEGIRIRLYAAEFIENGKGTAKTETAYTDSRGRYSISVTGFSRPITCAITADDPDEEYDIQKQELNIPWSGISFNNYIGYFYVNDCDFFMEKLLR